MTTTMKLSEAMRFGAMLGPQLKFKRHGGSGANCAIGAIDDAIGGYWSAENTFPTLVRREVIHPVTGDKLRLIHVIISLNNGGPTINPVLGRAHLEEPLLLGITFPAWTREEIATWLETIEPQDQPTPTTEQWADILGLPEPATQECVGAR